MYDHPLVKVSSRDALLTHFILLHLLASPSLLPFTPTALISHAKGILSAIYGTSARGVGAQSVEKSMTPAAKGKSKLAAEEEWLGLPFEAKAALTRSEHPSNTTKWRLWDVSAECREIGGMECYDGYHLAMIEQYVV